jgi:L-alanine-DL-glutamate epimerase-like enolase superfamily enzyme
MLVDDLLKEPLVIKNSCLELSDTPGLGIDLDQSQLEKFKML